MHYRIACLAGGQPAGELVTPSSAAAAVDLAHARVTADGTAFELLSVQLMAGRPDNADTSLDTPA